MLKQRIHPCRFAPLYAVARSRLKTSAHHHDCRGNVLTSDSRSRSSSSKLDGGNRGARATGSHPSSAMVRRASFRQRPLPPKQLLGCCVQQHKQQGCSPFPPADRPNPVPALFSQRYKWPQPAHIRAQDPILSKTTAFFSTTDQLLGHATACTNAQNQTLTGACVQPAPTPLIANPPQANKSREQPLEPHARPAAKLRTQRSSRPAPG